VAVPLNVTVAVVTACPETWLVIVRLGAVVSDVEPPDTVQTNERDTVARPSLTNTVTLYVPAVVGVPEICPVD
jgi:hypothetical protein